MNGLAVLLAFMAGGAAFAGFFYALYVFLAWLTGRS